MSYAIISDSDETFSVIEYPSFADERAFNRLLMQAETHIVPDQEKEALCEKWGWEYEEVAEERYGYAEYHRELAKVIFEEAEALKDVDPDALKPGLIQEARTDFIEGCRGRNGEDQGSSLGALVKAIRSLTGQNDTGTATPSGVSTA